MEANVVAGVGLPVETGSPPEPGGVRAMHVRMLGPLAIRRGGVALPLPASRKLRALLAYLALAPRPVARSQLCELLWDAPSDPRGELRWCLSKLRSVLDEPARRRVETREDAVRLDLSGCLVDAIEVGGAAAQGIGTLPLERCRSLALLFEGDFLEGLELEDSPVFNAWVIAQRRRLRDCHAALLEHLARSVPDDEGFAYLEKWLHLAPFDRQVHAHFLGALARRGRIPEGDEHVAATARLFAAEGVDHTPIREAWRAARSQAARAPHAASGLMPGIASADNAPEAAARRASVAVMPFAEETPAQDGRASAGRALAHDVITRLAKLRSLFVIAQGTVFVLHERGIGPEEAGRMLNVDYLVSGSVRQEAERLAVSVELVETRSARIVWAEVFNHRCDDALLVLDEIGNRIVASIATEIETLERNRAILRPPDSLDAWEAHHRGLWHMYRFSRRDNEQARHFFQTAVRLDPTFARAYAGLSFTYFQDAFQGWDERGPAIELAFETADQSLLADDRDPGAHWAMGRALWLRERQDQSVTELEQAIDLSPNFAQGHYTLSFVQSQAGDAGAAIASSDHSRQLSPFDPLLFGMLGARAIALVRLGRFEEAAQWAVKAAARPNAHPHIVAIATFSLALAGSLEEAAAHRAALLRALPRYGIDDFLRAFRFDEEGTALFRAGAKRMGMA